jgi:hypothetical protein
MRHQFIFLCWPCSSLFNFIFSSSKAIWRWRHQRNQSYRELSLRCSLRYRKSLRGTGYPPLTDSLLSSKCRILDIKLGNDGAPQLSQMIPANRSFWDPLFSYFNSETWDFTIAYFIGGNHEGDFHCRSD